MFRSGRRRFTLSCALAFLAAMATQAEGETPAARVTAGPLPATVALFDASLYAPGTPLPVGVQRADLLDREGQRWVCKTASFDRTTCSSAAAGLFARWTRPRRDDTGGSLTVEVRVLPSLGVAGDAAWAQAAWVATHGASQQGQAALRAWRKGTLRVAESDVQWGAREETPAWGLSRYEERQGFILYVFLRVDGHPSPAVRAELRRAFVDVPLGAAPTPEQTVQPAAAPACAPAQARASYSECQAAEVTGAPPCEDICLRPRTLTTEDPCCEDPVEVVVLAGRQILFRAAACRHVPPQCANTHGHGRMDAHLRVLAGSPPELLLVEGGCEARALMHRYVPPGVAAWTGCRHTRYRWNGQSFVALPQPNR